MSQQLVNAQYPASDDHRTYAVELELDFLTTTILVKDGIVVEARNPRLKWTMEKDDEPRETTLTEVLDWYQKPDKPLKDEDGEIVEGEFKEAEFISARVVGILNR